MGLDNGIILRTNTKISIKHGEGCYVPEYVNLEKMVSYHGDFQYAYEVCYFRKSWAFRDMVFTVLDNRKGEPVCDNGSTDLTPHEIEKIRDGLLEFFKNPEEWDDGAQVFYMDEAFAHIAQDALNLTWLVEWLKDNPRDLVYFYDSY